MRIEWPLSVEFVKQYPNRSYSHFSSDGRWIAFGAYERRDKPAIFLLRRGEDHPQLLCEGSGFPHWFSDPARVHLWSEKGDEADEKFGFITIDPETGQLVKEFQPFDLKPVSGFLPGGNQFSMTNDRRWLFFTYQESEGDIYTADIVEE